MVHLKLEFVLMCCIDRGGRLKERVTGRGEDGETAKNWNRYIWPGERQEKVTDKRRKRKWRGT